MTDADEAPAPFDEETYLRFNPDVRAALAAGLFASGRDHYERYGKAEGRQFKKLAPGTRDRVVVTGNLDVPRVRPRNWACTIDHVTISRSGGIFLAGWVNDYMEVLESIDLYFGEWAVSFDGAGIARCRRPDVEAARDLPPRHSYGFWAFNYAGRRLPAGPCSVVIRLKSGPEASLLVGAEAVEDDELRGIVLAHMEHAAYFGPAAFEATSGIAPAIGAQLVAFNKAVAKKAVNAPYAERFGQTERAYKGSIITCLYGRPEFMFLQQALFSQAAGVRDYEFVTICNSPELAETLLEEAKQCSLTYGLDQTVVILGANAGFGAANNLAAEYASSNRLLMTNPDVFPRDAAFFTRHTALVESAPPEQTALFGVPLYYDDGSLMHGGMYFEMDTLPRFPGSEMQELSLLRVEHYGKGAPPDTAAYLRPRKVPAVSGAFMSIESAWFQKLGGFSNDYVLGHYEDADFCLKSLAKGRPAWMQDMKLWHMEGKGSAGKTAQRAFQTLNRWQFTKSWGAAVQADLLGSTPSNPALA